jgi:purine nucleoside permease
MIELFTSDNGHRAAVDLTQVQAVLEDEQGRSVLVTSNDTYRVKECFDDVVAQWKEAKQCK